MRSCSITRELLKPENEQRPYVLQPFWSIGLLGIIVGAVADSLALGFAAASVVTPVGGFTIVANASDLASHSLLSLAI
jgi:demethoxyubiquinone hydroxylase (CLK1/Coq7/Cat5 family)